MQAISVAIGKTGIDFFAEQYLANLIIDHLGQIIPPGRTIPIPNINDPQGDTQINYSNISVVLSGGSLSNFVPIFKSITQGVSTDPNPVPIFTIEFEADNFSVNYTWTENYHWDKTVQSDGYSGPITVHTDGDSSTPLSYNPTFKSFTADIIIKFTFDQPSNSWEVSVVDTSAQTVTNSVNIPSNSILQLQDQDCSGSHVDDATAQAIDAIDFAAPVNNLISGVIKSIPDSGDLGNGIVYDFSLGDSGLLFPNNDGIQMGVKGGACYSNTPFSGETPPSLPLPVPPSDTDAHHLNMYVSNYEIDALYWAYFEAGKLNLVVDPSDLSDKDILEVATYITVEKSLQPYNALAMQAQIAPTAAPVSAFQLVWVLSQAVIDAVKTKLSSVGSSLLPGLMNSAYISQSSLEQTLTDATIPASDFSQIEQAAQSMGMVINNTLNFDLIIQTFQPNPPDIKFSVTRTDVLSNLRLGVGANNTQTLQFDFTNVTFSSEFISSTVPGFIGEDFSGSNVWGLAGEPQYINALTEMGGQGVPLPIMQNFQFDFGNAELSIQEGYVSILASVLYKNE